jgi:hypothetical protein
MQEDVPEATVAAALRFLAAELVTSAGELRKQPKQADDDQV